MARLGLGDAGRRVVGRKGKTMIQGVQLILLLAFLIAAWALYYRAEMRRLEKLRRLRMRWEALAMEWMEWIEFGRRINAASEAIGRRLIPPLTDFEKALESFGKSIKP